MPTSWEGNKKLTQEKSETSKASEVAKLAIATLKTALIRMHRMVKFSDKSSFCFFRLPSKKIFFNC